MKYGTVIISNKIYDLDSMNLNEIEELYNSNTIYKNTEYANAKKVCNRENVNMEGYDKYEIPKIFKSFLDNSSTYAKNSALIHTALIQRNSYDAIVSKVNNKRNAINSSIKSINSNFNNSNKKYKDIFDEIDKCFKKYENLLDDIKIFYDNKIEQLIMNKLELEADVIGSIIKEEYYIEEDDKNKNAKENDKLLVSLSDSVKSFISKLSKKKEDNEVIDVRSLSNFQDRAELEQERKNKLDFQLESTKENINSTIENIANYEAQIASLDREIRRLNENKISEIMSAMESGSKQLIVSKRNNNIGLLLKTFFKSKVNPIGLIQEEVINPFKETIDFYEMQTIENSKI